MMDMQHNPCDLQASELLEADAKPGKKKMQQV